MSVNYTEAARRHIEDACLLDEGQRSGNSSHLAGLAAECALKSILHGLGKLTLENGKPREKELKQHIDKLWGQFQVSVDGAAACEYLPALGGTNPFADWRIDRRYDENAALSRKQARAHLDAAKMVVKVLAIAQQRGEVQ